MGVALFIVPERGIDGVDRSVSGNAIGRESHEAVDSLCKNLGVTSLYDFCSQAPEELADFMEGEGIEIPEELLAVAWFEAADGLKTVRAMRQALENSDSPFENTDGVLGDLKEYEAILARLDAEGVRWHMQVDF